jgi:hypothetical protein
MEYKASALFAIADQLALPILKHLARGAGVKALYRLTVRYHDRRAADSVATLTARQVGPPLLEVHYRGLFEQKPLAFKVDAARYEAFTQTLQDLRFDTLTDQPAIPSYGTDLWLLERAAGSFSTSVVIAPALATGLYASLVALIRARLPETIREIPLTR